MLFWKIDNFELWHSWIKWATLFSCFWYPYIIFMFSISLHYFHVFDILTLFSCFRYPYIIFMFSISLHYFHVFDIFSGVSAPRTRSVTGSALPNERVVASSILVDRNDPDQSFTLSVMQWGQFIDHDLTHAPFASLSEFTMKIFENIEKHKILKILKKNKILKILKKIKYWKK